MTKTKTSDTNSSKVKLFELKLELAYSLAGLLLVDATDKQGRPLMEHVDRVSNILIDTFEAQEERIESMGDQIIAALLHDCAEDGKLNYGHGHKTKYTERIIDIIFDLFGSEVGRLVSLLTRKEGQSYDQYIRNLATDDKAIPIKLADIADNLDTRRGPMPDLIKQNSLRQRYEKAREYLQARLILHA